MMGVQPPLLDFLVRAIPTLWMLGLGLLPSVLWGWGCLWVAGWARRRWGLKVGYSRKVFHVLIFSMAAGVQAVWGLAGVCVFGIGASVPIFGAVWRGEGDGLFEAIARPGDAPERGRYVLLPWATTVAGGLFVNIFLPGGALTGYLMAGLADAAGEPVGTRWGRHRYRVLLGREAYRSREGSLGVLAVGWMVAFGVMLAVVPGATEPLNWPFLLFLAGMVAFGSAVVEAVTPHGWDNFTMQVAPAWMMVGVLAFLWHLEYE